MRRLIGAAAFSLLAGCGGSYETPRFDDTAIMLNVADQRADKQLTRGFFPLEGTGRWTGRSFSATLKPPPTAARKGAVLMLRFGIPGTSIDAMHSIQISAAVNGVALKPQEYTQAGEFEYVRDVPAAAFRSGDAAVDFSLDKALAAGGNERRELGVIVNTVGFESK
ncbi:MAG: hypothetical protein ABSH09_01125 [Bryobacteraceae bacterium]